MQSYVASMGDEETTPAGPVELRTERLLLRQPSMDDVERLAEIANDRRVARNLTPAFPHPYTVEDAIKFVESKPSGFAIVPIEPPDEIGPGMVGMVGGGPADNTTGVYIFGYWLGFNAWGHGYATEAATAYLDHMVATEPVRRVEAGVFAWNPASGRVLEKLGFDFEGRMKARAERFGEITDELWYAKLIDQ